MTQYAAFSVRLTENTTPEEAPLIFDMVDLNIEEGYDQFQVCYMYTHEFWTYNSFFILFC